MKCGTYALSSIAMLFGDLENASVYFPFIL